MTIGQSDSGADRLTVIADSWETAPDQQKLLFAEELRGLVAGRELGPSEAARATGLLTTIEAQLTVPGP